MADPLTGVLPGASGAPRGAALVRERVRAAVEAGERIRGRAAAFATGAFVVLALVFAAVAAATGDTFFLRLGTEALILAGLAMAVDLLLGCGGLLSLGHALFFGFGAYVSALVLKHWMPSFWLALGTATIASAAIGLVAGAIFIRARGVYFALITFGLAQVLFKVVYNTRELGGSDGIIGVPQIDVGIGPLSVRSDAPLGFFLATLVIIVGLYLALAYLMRTPFGRALLALKANQSRVPFLGFAPWKTKLAAFVVSAVVAGLSGSLYPMLRGFVAPELLAFNTSGNAVIMVILGGVGTLSGALWGSAILTGLKSVIGTWTEHHLIVIGLLFMLSVIFLPKGLLGVVLPALEKRLGGGGGR
jgi:branched-chain amino acid transport system permease protein